MMRYKILLAGGLIATIASLSACEKKEDITETVNKAGSVETAVAISHVDAAHDELVTTHKVWVKYDVFKTIEYRDTIPSLGTERTTAENEDGDTKNVEVKKDYEIYITVK
jgi:hypothetical protein